MGRAFALAGSLFALLLAGPAGASFPGKNGRLVFDGTDLQPTQLSSVTTSGSRAALGLGDSPTPSPDGSKIAFQLGDYPDEQLWVENADGTGRTQTPCDGSPSWAPDSSRLACVEGLDVVVLDTATGKTTKVASNAFSPLWSPEGTWIAYLDVNIDSLSVVHPDGTGDTLMDLDAYDAAWAPDGTKLAYTSTEGNSYVGEESEPHSVWVVTVPSGEPVQLHTDDLTKIYYPSFSPDSTRVSYVEDFSGPERDVPNPPPDEVYVAGAGGTGRVRMPCDGDLAWAPDSTRVACVKGSALRVVPASGGTALTVGTGFGPEWAPDGSQIAFAGAGVDVVKPDGTGRRTLADEPDTAYSGILWLQDSASIVYASSTGGLDREIFTSASDGSDLKKLTNNQTEEYDAVWSPNGKRIAYVHEVITKDPEDVDNAELYVMNADGTHKRRLTRHPGFDWEPSWSPDGRRIAFVREYKNVNLDLAVLDLRTHRVKRLTRTESDERWPSWSPNGRWIAFVRGDGVGGSLHLISPNGRVRRLIRTPGLVLHPTWAPSGQRIGYERDDYPCPPEQPHCDAVISPWATALGRNAQALGSQDLEDPSWSPDGRLLVGDGGTLLDVGTGQFSAIAALKPYDPKSFDWQRIR